ncbi:hypothetical protein [Burkholderia pseudomallei]|uniref:hypothetical protein n=1 Tax=Burkholderia pseudomallei TaxID=28450 RepID=UPI0011788249|nr:hypothetical protein [Burkholderia pseudomallei]
MTTRIMAAIAIGVSAAFVAACGGGGDGGSSSSNTPAPPTPIGLASSYTVPGIQTGGGDTYDAPIANAKTPSNPYISANQNPRGFAMGNFGGNGCPAILAAPSYYQNYPKLPIQVWTSDCHGHFTLATSNAVSGTVPVTGFADAVLVGDFNKSGADSVFISDQGLEDKDSANPGFDGETNKLLLNQGGKLVDVSATNLPPQGLNFNHVSTIYHANVPGGQTIVLVRLGGPQLEGSGVQLLVNDGTGKFNADVSTLPPELAFHTNTNTDPTVDYVGPGTAALLDLDNSGSPYLVAGTYSSGTALTQQHAVFIYKLVGGKYQKYATIPIPAAYANIPYTTGSNATSSTISLGASNIVEGDFEGTGHPDIAVLWEGSNITRLQLIHNDGAGNFSDITASANVPPIDVQVNNGNFSVSSIKTVTLTGGGKQQLELMQFRPIPLNVMTTWKPVLQFVNGQMQYMDVFNGADMNTIASQLGIGDVNTPLELNFANFGTGKTDLMATTWGPGVTQGAFTVYNNDTQHVLLHK